MQNGGLISKGVSFIDITTIIIIAAAAAAAAHPFEGCQLLLLLLL